MARAIQEIDEETREYLAFSVQARRDYLSMSQTAVAAAGGPSPSMLSKIENGKVLGLSGRVLSGLDRALRWDPGTSEAIVSGRHDVHVPLAEDLITKYSHQANDPTEDISQTPPQASPGIPSPDEFMTAPLYERIRDLQAQIASYQLETAATLRQLAETQAEMTAAQTTIIAALSGVTNLPPESMAMVVEALNKRIGQEE